MGGTLMLLFFVPAHPLPVMRYDRAVNVRLTAAGVEVRYSLTLNELSMILDRESSIASERPAGETTRQFAVEYAKNKEKILADRLIASLGGLPLTLHSTAAPEIVPDRDHLEFRYRFAADWPTGVERGKPLPFAFEDTNYESVLGKLAISLQHEVTLDVDDIVDPGGLRNISPLDLKPGDEAKLRKCSATLTLPKRVTLSELAQDHRPPVFVGERPGLIEDLRGRGLIALFDSDAGIGLLLLAALLFGVAHAFTPGHGKTLVAAYLIGERGTMKHAFVLGLSTTLAHTGSVIAIAIVLWSVYRDGVPETAQGWLQFAGGSLIFAVGLWLLLQRLRGRADHVHLFNDHHHHEDRRSFGWSRVLLLGLGGGLIPCWDAVMLLLVAIAAGRLGFAIPMLIAFSVGLAAVLVALGVGVVLAHRAGLARFGEQRWFRALPAISAALLLAMGLWLARDGVQLLSQTAKG